MTRLEVLQPFVEQTIATYLGIEEVQVSEDGTIPIRAGTTLVNVRLVEGDRAGHPVLQVFAPVLAGVKDSPELLAKLNEVNASLSFVRAFWVGDQVIFAMELLAESLDQDQVAHAVSLMSLAADFWDTELVKTFGGSTAFPDPPADAAPAPAPSAEGADPGASPVASGDGPKGEGPPAAGYI